jgi:hypothetical protein
MDEFHPSVILIQETMLLPKPENALVSSFVHPDYKMFFKTRNKDKGTRGILTAVLKSIPAKENDKTTMSEYKYAHECIDVTITTDSGPLRIINVYSRHTARTPSQIKSFLGVRAQDLILKLDQFIQPPLPTFIAGDFNAHHPSWDTDDTIANPPGKLIAKFLEANVEEYTLLNDGSPTYCTNTENSAIQTAIDLTIVSHHLMGKCKWELTNLVANHIGICTTIGKMKHTPAGIPSSRVWNTKEANWDIYKINVDAVLANDSQNADIIDLTNIKNLEKGAQHIVKLINEACEMTFKPNGKKGNSKPPGKPPWKDHPDYIALNRLRNREQRLWKKARKDRNIEAAAIHRLTMNQHKRQMQVIMNDTDTKLKSEFINSLTRSTSNSLVWRKVYKLNGIPSPAAPLLNTEEVKIEANMLIDRFADRSSNRSLTEDIRKHRAETKDENLEIIKKARKTKDPVTDIPFTPAEILSALKKLKPGSSPGEDGVSNEILIHSPPVTYWQTLRAVQCLLVTPKIGTQLENCSYSTHPQTT